MNRNEVEIIDMIRHYFVFKDIFSRKLLHKALEILRENRNPFLYIKDYMEKEIEAKNSNYYLNSEVFSIKLENDR